MHGLYAILSAVLASIERAGVLKKKPVDTLELANQQRPIVDPLNEHSILMPDSFDSASMPCAEEFYGRYWK